jgi:hypothetical protein
LGLRKADSWLVTLHKTKTQGLLCVEAVAEETANSEDE